MALCPAMATIPACCGFAPHCAQNGASEAGGATRKLTVTVAGEPVVPVEVMVMWPVFTLAGSAPTAALIWRGCGAVPLAGVRESHGESLAVENERVPPPTFETVTEVAAGLAPPCTAVNEAEVEEIERTAGTGGRAPIPAPQPAAIAQSISANRKSAKRFIAQPGRIYDESANLEREEFQNNVSIILKS